VSVSGDVIALAALALNQITGSSIPQGVAAVLIALVLIRVSLRLIRRSHDFLVGAWATGATSTPSGRRITRLTQPLRPADEERVQAFLLGYPGVIAIRELLVTFVGPGRVWLVARVDIDDGLRGTQVEALVQGIESGLKDGDQVIVGPYKVLEGLANDTKVRDEKTVTTQPTTKP